AGRARAGYLESASGGTLFLDEVTSLPLHLQPVLLRALQEGEIQRLGAYRPIKVDTRVIAATNADIEAEIDGGRLRADFVYRLNTLSLHAPPLRERLEDIPILFAAFATRAAEREGRPDLADNIALSAADLAALRAHRWPGNVRELANLAERAVVRARRGSVEIAGLLDGPSGPPISPPAGAQSGLRERLEAYERALLEEALTTHGGNIAAVMEALALPRRTLNEKLVRHGLAARDFRSST
ncbi:MAG: sigma 54-interacting transcriptional regulator, partial [Pseudomonadota bacterium]